MGSITSKEHKLELYNLQTSLFFKGEILIKSARPRINLAVRTAVPRLVS